MSRFLVVAAALFASLFAAQFGGGSALAQEDTPTPADTPTATASPNPISTRVATTWRVVSFSDQASDQILVPAKGTRAATIYALEVTADDNTVVSVDFGNGVVEEFVVNWRNRDTNLVRTYSLPIRARGATPVLVRQTESASVVVRAQVDQ